MKANVIVVLIVDGMPLNMWNVPAGDTTKPKAGGRIDQTRLREVVAEINGAVADYRTDEVEPIPCPCEGCEYCHGRFRVQGHCGRLVTHPGRFPTPVCDDCGDATTATGKRR